MKKKSFIFDTQNNLLIVELDLYFFFFNKISKLRWKIYFILFYLRNLAAQNIKMDNTRMDGVVIDADDGANGISVLFEFKLLHPCPVQIKQCFALRHFVSLSDKQPRSIVSSKIIRNENKISISGN